MKPKFTTSNAIELILFCTLGLVPRLLLLITNKAGIESDEAIIGLMAKHILGGEAFPVFYYGQSYMGSLEAIFAALSFKILGISNLSLKLVPLSFSIILIGINYYFGFILKGNTCARIAAFFTAIAPSPLIVWSLKARGGFIETVVIGSLCLLFTVKFVLKNDRRFSPSSKNSIAIIGFLSGLGWWTNNQIIFYFPSIAFGLLIILSRFQLKQTISAVGVGLFYFALGSSPFWYHNLMIKPRWSTFEVLFGKSAGDNKLEYFQGYLDTALPIILGARKFWAEQDIFDGATLLTYALYILVFIIGIRPTKQARNYRILGEAQQSKTPTRMLVIFLITVPIIFSLSSFGWLSQAPRYLLPLYSAIPLILGIYLTYGLQANFFKRMVSTFVLFSICLLNLCSNYLGGIADEGQPMLYKGQRVSADQSTLYNWLKEHKYTHIYTNYWIGYRMAFETNEEITFSVFGNPRTTRIPKYQSKGATTIDLFQNFADKVFVLAPSEANELLAWIQNTGYCARIQPVGNYLIIDKIKEKYPEGTKITLKPEQFRSFIPPDNSKVATSAVNFKGLIDGDLESRWGSGTAQTLGMAIELDFKEPQIINRIVLRLGKFYHDAPRSLNISGISQASGKRVEIFSSLKTKFSFESELIEMLPDWDLRFSPLNLSMLRFELIKDAPVFDWSIAELEIFSPPSDPGSQLEMCDY